MANLKTGDKVLCRLSLGLIVSVFSEYDDERVFEIIALDEYGYYLYVPEYLYIKHSVNISNKTCKQLSIDNKFIDSKMLYINDGLIYKVHSILDGCACKKCKEFFHQAQPNQKDGTMLCFLCRTYPYR